MSYCTAGDVFPSQRKVYQVRAVADWSYRTWTLQYRSEGLGAVARMRTPTQDWEWSATLRALSVE